MYRVLLIFQKRCNFFTYSIPGAYIGFDRTKWKLLFELSKITLFTPKVPTQNKTRYMYVCLNYVMRHILYKMNNYILFYGLHLCNFTILQMHFYICVGDILELLFCFITSGERWTFKNDKTIEKVSSQYKIFFVQYLLLNWRIHFFGKRREIVLFEPSAIDIYIWYNNTRPIINTLTSSLFLSSSRDDLDPGLHVDKDRLKI